MAPRSFPGSRRGRASSPRSSSRAADLWVSSGLVDVEFYGALRGRPFPGEVDAAEDLVAHGMAQCLSPHPLLDFASLPQHVRRAWREQDVEGVLGHLAGADGRVHPVGPLTGLDPEETRGPILDLAIALGDERRDQARAAASVTAVDPEAPRAGLFSVVVVAGPVRPTRRAVESLVARNEHGADAVEVIVVDPGARPHVSLGLHAAFWARDEVELVRVARPASRIAATAAGLTRARGEHVLLLSHRAVVRRDALAELAAALSDPEVGVVQPVLLAPDDTIASAGMGIASAGRRPEALLAGHPPEDAWRLAGEPLVGLSVDAVALRSRDVPVSWGSDSWNVGDAVLSLCGRLLTDRPSGLRLAPRAVVTLRSPTVTRAVPGLSTRPLSPTAAAPRRSASSPRRWSLNLPSAPGRSGDAWGDTHFAAGLAAALRRLGQDVVTRRRGAHAAGPTGLDDVSLAVRGLYPVAPAPGQLNVLWIISHPDDVDPAELDGYDVVCAASTTWSAELSALTGRVVTPLLQATEFAEPDVALPEVPTAVFVGSALGRPRPLVRAALDAGIPLRVHGPGWEGLPEGVWAGRSLDNRSVPAVYRSHGIVLADHWPDMARHGFIANRVFDAVACGARVISDDVVGLDRVFDPRDVRVARDAEEVSHAYATLAAELDRGTVERPALTFDDRARTLVELVTAR